jgi:tRNA A-37 threonylcarbamoyl transferase component Bud32
MSNDRPEDGGGVLAGRYELGPLIGTGATARVYRAVDRELGRAVAVKVYDHHVLPEDALRRARERTLLASIQHPRVVAVYDTGTEERRPYLVLQLVDGENLAERLLAGPLPAEEVHELAISLSGALAHVHARHIVHRDLKPANVLLGAGGPMITDFGIAHALDSTRVTGTGLVTGTAAYLAPEQILGEQAGPPADVYALGLILLECLTAQREFPGTLAESAIARLHRAPRIPEGTPEPLAHALRRMTAREPADRPAAEEVPQLLAAVAEVPLTVSAPVRRRRASTAACVLATAAAGVLALVLAQPADPANSPARLPAAAPPPTATPSQVTVPPATAVVVASEAAKPVAVGVAVPPKPVPAKAKPGGGPHAELGKAHGPGDGRKRTPRSGPGQGG